MLSAKIALVLTLSAVNVALGFRVTLSESLQNTITFQTCAECTNAYMFNFRREKGLWCVFGKDDDQIRLCIAPGTEVVEDDGRVLCSSKNAKPTCDYPEGSVELTQKMPDYSHMLHTCAECLQDRGYGYAITKWFVGRYNGRRTAACVMEGYDRDASAWYSREKSTANHVSKCEDIESEDEKSQLPAPCVLRTCDACLNASRHLNYGWCVTKKVCVRRHAVHVAGCTNDVILTNSCPGKECISPNLTPLRYKLPFESPREAALQEGASSQNL